MNAQNIVSALLGRKGQHCPIVWERDCKIRKGARSIRKRTLAYVRTGIDYANLASVANGIANGERGPVGPIWNGKGEWQTFPFIVRHVDTGADYVRLYPASFANLKPSVQFLFKGQPITLDDARGDLLASELRHDDGPPDCFTVKAGDVIAIG